MQLLISVCNEEIAAKLKENLLFINRRWKELSDSVKQFNQDQSIKANLEQFYTTSSNIVETIEKIDREIQEYLPCTTKALKEQETRLYVRTNDCFSLSRDSFVHDLESPIRTRYTRKKHRSLIEIKSKHRPREW